jgi:hypothetical protein
MRDVDSEAIAGELRPIEAPRPPRAWAPRARGTLRIGFRAGALPGAAVFAIYFLAHHELPMPWVRIASILAIYGPAVGVLLALSTDLLVALFDRIARAGYGLRVLANPVTAGGLAGALSGIVPGAIGVTVFGSYHGPFVGTGLIAFALIAGSMMVAVPLALRERRARFAHGHRRAVATAAVLATLILCAVASVLAPLIVNAAFAEVRGAVAEHGLAVGAVSGLIGGGIVGVYVGLVIALGRSQLRRDYSAGRADSAIGSSTA